MQGINVPYLSPTGHVAIANLRTCHKLNIPTLRLYQPPTGYTCQTYGIQAMNQVYLPDAGTGCYQPPSLYPADIRYTGNEPGIPTRCWNRLSKIDAGDHGTTHRKGDDDTETSHDRLQVIWRRRKHQQQQQQQQQQRRLPPHKHIASIHLLTTSWFDKKEFKIGVLANIINNNSNTPQNNNNNKQTNKKEKQKRTNKQTKKRTTIAAAAAAAAATTTNK